MVDCLPLESIVDIGSALVDNVSSGVTFYNATP